MAKSEFSTFLEQEVRKVKGIAYPVKAGFLRRVLISKAACSKLHPNPNDEFCIPEIGPSASIMARYMSVYRALVDNKRYEEDAYLAIQEPIMVEKIYPDGYMILNGHHRWGAACRVGIHTLRIKIVDLTQESNLKAMLESSSSTRRVSLDLDEVIFQPEGDSFLEKPLRFPLNRFFKERLRLGIPALFNMLNQQGYDIWIYTKSYYSLDYLRYYFKHYHVHVTGIITGTERKAPVGTDTRKVLETRIKARYKTTVHVDNRAVIRTNSDTGEFDEYCLSGNSETWSREVMDIFEKMRKDELSE